MACSTRPVEWITAVALSLAVATAAVRAQSLDPAGRHDDARTGDIKVSGYWTIDVRNADGSLAAHREFENALTPNGGGLLGILLNGSGTVGSMLIELDNTSQPSKPCGSACLILPNTPIFQNSNFFTGPSISKTLSITPQVVGEPRLVLTGLATPTGGAINTVRTSALVACLDPPAPCSIQSGGFTIPIIPFTEFTLSPALNVQGGQVVQVTVVLSFS